MMKMYDLLKSYYERNADKDKLWGSVEKIGCVMDKMKDKHPEKYWSLMREVHEVWNGKHYDTGFAIYEVNNMYHLEDGKEIRGEFWSKKQTDDVLSQYRNRVPQSYNECDFYVALNASYHDLVVSKKKRYPDTYQIEIIEDAIAFWFNDDDKAEGKVWWYFNK